MLTIAVVQKSTFKTSLMFLLPAIRMSPGTGVDHSVLSVKVSSSESRVFTAVLLTPRAGLTLSADRTYRPCRCATASAGTGLRHAGWT